MQKERIMSRYIFTNGNILTMDDTVPFAEAVAVDGGLIAATGALDDMKALMPDAEVRDLQGHTLLPGFIDGHSHFPSGGMNRLFGADMAVTTMAELQGRLKKKAAEDRPNEWIIGHSFDEQFMEGKRFPTIRELDEVSTQYPIFMRHVSGHTGYVNSRALAMAGITRDTPNPAGGIIGRNPDGTPNGVLEGIPAQTLVRRLIPSYSREEMKQALLAESLVYAAAGITTAQGGPAFSPMDAEMGYEVTKLFLDCARDGSLPLRTVLFVRANRLDKLDPYPSGRAGTDLSGCGMVTLGAAKLWADGDPRAHTGYFSSPYTLRREGEGEFFGEFLYTPEELTELILPMHLRGWQIAIHANGDAGIETVLTAYENLQRRAPRPDARHLIIHSQYATQKQLMRMAMAGVYPCFFTAPLFYWDHIHEQEVGRDRVENFCPLGDAARLGLRFNLHTDSPILPVDPLIQVGLAVTRTSRSGTVRGRHQALSPWRALKAVTIDAAFLNFEEDRKGSIRPGKYADFVVLEKNPLEVPGEEIKDIKVLTTIVGGQDVYQAR